MSWRITADAREIFVELVATNDEKSYLIRTVNRKDQLTFGLSDSLILLPADVQEAVKKGDVPLTVGSDLQRVSLREHWGSKAALICTEGFETLTEIGTQERLKTFGLHADKDHPLIPREYCFGLTERTNASGGIERALGHEEVEFIVKKLELSEVKNVALCFLHSKKNPANEKQLAQTLKEKGFTVFCSHEELGNELQRSKAVSQKAFLSGADHEFNEKIKSFGFKDFLASPTRLAFKSSRITQTPQNTLYMEFLEDRIVIKFGDKTMESPLSPLHLIEQDEGGLFHLGPTVIDAEPGPVCFGKGLQLTCLDILAWKMKLSNPDIPRLKMDWSKSTRLMNPYSQSLRIDTETFAERVYSLFVESLALQIESLLNQTPTMMVAAGWLGPSLGPALSRRLGIRKVFVAPHSGWYGALQLLEKDLKTTSEIKRIGNFDGGLPGALKEGEIHDF